MEFLYTCRNQNCSFPGKNHFEMAIDEETVMDDKNMATVFCPFCKKEMAPKILMNPQSLNKNMGRSLH